MEENHLQFSYNARYFQLGKLDGSCKRILFVLHGYGQQAKFFIRKFSSLDDGQTCIIAPEGLSRFYLEGFSGRVGATWMTKEDRLTDIENYISYLDKLYITLQPSFPSNVEVTVLGFSQGSATVSRWIASGTIQFKRLILWAGIFPPDMDFQSTSSLLSQKDIHYVYGLKDKFVSIERLREMKVLSDKLNIKPTVSTFDGEHTIDAEFLAKLLY